MLSMVLCVHIVTLIYVNPCKYFVEHFADACQNFVLSTLIYYPRTLFDRSYLGDRYFIDRK